MAQQPTKVLIGAFAQGEIPVPITHTFFDFNEEPIDISAFATRAMRIEGVPDPGVSLGTNPVDFLTDGTDGKIVYQWTDEDMAHVGDFEAQMWVYDGILRFASDLILYSVYDGPGEAPS